MKKSEIKKMTKEQALKDIIKLKKDTALGIVLEDIDENESKAKDKLDSAKKEVQRLEAELTSAENSVKKAREGTKVSTAFSSSGAVPYQSIADALEDELAAQLLRSLNLMQQNLTSANGN